MLARRSPFLLCALLSLCLLPLQAQIHGVPASVTSFGFGGSTSPAPGIPASVTSLGPNGFGNAPTIFGNCCFNAFFPNNGFLNNGFLNNGFPNNGFLRGNDNGHLLFPHHERRHHIFWPVAVPFAVPYTQVVVVPSDAYAEEGDEAYAADPASSDRRPSRDAHVRRDDPHFQKDYEEPEPAAPSQSATAPSVPAPELVTAQPNTVLIFKDGHKVEVQNYAIVGGTLFDVTDGRTHKIKLSDLDLPATRKANEDSGVDFRAPEGAQ